MKAIIVEDEAIAARRLQRMLEKKGIQVTQTISSVAALKKQVHSSDQPEIYFFDIHLNDGIVFEALEDIDFDIPIIFTTAYDQYAIKAFKQNSIDYLLKPIDDEELDAAISKYKKTNNQSVDVSALTALLNSAKQSPEKPSYRERISIRIGDKIKSLNVKDISFFYSDNKMNFLYTKEGRSYPIEHTIESISKELNPKIFYRVNRGYVVSINEISEIIAYSNSRLKVKINKADDHDIIVSREKVKEFKNWLG